MRRSGPKPKCQAPGCEKSVERYDSKWCSKACYFNRTGQKPICAREGCGQQVKHRNATWCSLGCIPRNKWAEWSQRSRPNYARRCREKLFRDVLARITADGPRLTRDDLLDAMMEVYRRAYNSGFQCASGQRKSRQAPKKAAA